MNYKLLPFIITSFISYYTFGQTKKEFEGIITYKTTIILKDNRLDSNAIYQHFGRERNFIYKQGKFKWVPKNVELEYEIFDPSQSPAILVDKLHTNDTLYFRDISREEPVIEIKKLTDKSIMGFLCKGASFSVQTNSNSRYPIIRTIYYSPTGINLTPSFFKEFKAMGQNTIYQYCQSIPLRLELDREDNPFILVYEAIAINDEPINDEIFLINSKLPVKK